MPSLQTFLLFRIFVLVVVHSELDILDAMATHVLYDSASGYAVFAIKQQEEVGSKTKQVQDALQDISKFGKMVSLLTFSPFKSAAHALENANDVSEGVSKCTAA